MNSSYDFCEAGLICFGFDNVGSCPGGSVGECPQIPENYNPDCVDGICGFSFCSPECDVMGNCPQGFVGQDFGGTCHCIPS